MFALLNDVWMCSSIICYLLGVLAGGTGTGKIGMWKYTASLGGAGHKEEAEDCWKHQSPSTVSGPVSDLAVSV